MSAPRNHIIVLLPNDHPLEQDIEVILPKAVRVVLESPPSEALGVTEYAFYYIFFSGSKHYTLATRLTDLLLNPSLASSTMLYSILQALKTRAPEEKLYFALGAQDEYLAHHLFTAGKRFQSIDELIDEVIAYAKQNYTIEEEHCKEIPVDEVFDSYRLKTIHVYNLLKEIGEQVAYGITSDKYCLIIGSRAYIISQE